MRINIFKATKQEGDTPVCSSTPLPCFSTNVQAGFPSPADDSIEQELNLHDLVVEHPAATFFVRVEGNSMIDANIHSGDLLVVDRSLTATDKKIVIAALDGEFTCKRLSITKNGVFLVSENSAYPPIEIKDESDCMIWGVVTYVIHKAC